MSVSGRVAVPFSTECALWSLGLSDLIVSPFSMLAAGKSGAKVTAHLWKVHRNSWLGLCVLASLFAPSFLPLFAICLRPSYFTFESLWAALNSFWNRTSINKLK